MMPARRSCAYYKYFLSNYLRCNERAMWRVTVESVRKFIGCDNDKIRVSVFVTLYDWEKHKDFQTILFKCFRLRKLDINILTLRRKLSRSLDNYVNATENQWSDLFVVTPYDEREQPENSIDTLGVYFQQHNCVPSLFLALEQLHHLHDINYNLLKVLESYTYTEIINVLSTYCTDSNRNQLVNVCVQLSKPFINDPVVNWRKFSNLKTALYKLGILQRVPLRSDGDYKFLKLLQCGPKTMNATCEK
ncbi:hypothetical protein [Mocis latipes granulovirus]|uniref:Uncharacterized protein n=1 Tax=Mocis latipes granulovirus TaxID=2072024 RepID=A0A162GWU4_9BBAC|nr:hypothetical protein [Mocis latipes granulovirus]AKR17514.1 hypothetical protein [Mocis latipes granulovirus]